MLNHALIVLKIAMEQIAIAVIIFALSFSELSAETLVEIEFGSARTRVHGFDFGQVIETTEIEIPLQKSEEVSVPTARANTLYDLTETDEEVILKFEFLHTLNTDSDFNVHSAGSFADGFSFNVTAPANYELTGEISSTSSLTTLYQFRAKLLHAAIGRDVTLFEDNDNFITSGDVEHVLDVDGTFPSSGNLSGEMPTGTYVLGYTVSAMDWEASIPGLNNVITQAHITLRISRQRISQQVPLPWLSYLVLFAVISLLASFNISASKFRGVETDFDI